MSALRPGMIQFAKLDLGEPLSSYGGLCCDSPASVSRKRYYPSLYIRGQKKEIALPDEGEAKIRFRTTGRDMNERNGERIHGATLEVISIETDEPEKKKPGQATAKKLAFGVLRPAMIALADSRPRNENGEYVANETGGADPNSMAAAYSGVAVEKRKRLGVIAKLRKALQPGMVPAPQSA